MQGFFEAVGIVVVVTPVALLIMFAIGLTLIATFDRSSLAAAWNSRQRGWRNVAFVWCAVVGHDWHDPSGSMDLDRGSPCRRCGAIGFII